jgi:hypothetical protein
MRSIPPFTGKQISVSQLDLLRQRVEESSPIAGDGVPVDVGLKGSFQGRKARAQQLRTRREFAFAIRVEQALAAPVAHEVVVAAGTATAIGGSVKAYEESTWSYDPDAEETIWLEYTHSTGSWATTIQHGTLPAADQDTLVIILGETCEDYQSRTLQRQLGDVLVTLPMVVPVALTQVGGADGDLDGPATWTYNVAFEGSVTTLLAAANPAASPHRHVRPALGSITPATYGYAHRLATGGWALGWINEVPVVAVCAADEEVPA